MTAIHSTLAAPTIRGRAASILVALVFVVGVVTGLLAARLAWPTMGAAADQSTSAYTSSQAYRDFRAGERDIPAVITDEQIQRAWMDFRAGERDDPPSR
jgi:hypothetical protein